MQFTLSAPKRHHWWPQFQSGHWTDEGGCITAVRADGSTFRAPPDKLGVEGELYTRYQLAGEKDLTIERWFSSEIEGPFGEALARLATLEGIVPAWKIGRDPAKEQELRELGFKVPKHAEIMRLDAPRRAAIDAYLAALLVRNPRYLRKLVAFHDDHGTPLPDALPRHQAIKTVALDNMLQVFEIYRDQISKSHIALLVAEGDTEFLFGDAGITAHEPWRKGPIPFDIHAPLTPNLALEVLPAPFADVDGLMVMRLNNRGAARMNRITLGDCERFVFCRGSPPLAFIARNFGRPAPQTVGFRMKEGRLETHYDRSRDRP
jgi:hypothetical protein